LRRFAVNIEANPLRINQALGVPDGI